MLGRSGWVVGVVLALGLMVVTGKAVAEPLAVGYDDPGTDRGGPVFSDDGSAWVHRVFPQAMTLAPDPAWNEPTVMFLTNYAAAPTVQALARRFPMRVLHLRHGEIGHTFPGRDAFERKLDEVERIDCFVVSRMDVSTIPLDVQYEIFRRVKEEGAGLVVIDVFDSSETFNPEFLGIEWRKEDVALFPGIPHESFRQWAYQDQVTFDHVHHWRTGGKVDLDPQAEPFAYREGRLGRLGRGTVVWMHTGSDPARARFSGHALIPHIQQRRDMWIETDYHFSHAAKAIRRASNIQPRAEIAAVRFVELDDGEVVTELVTQNYTPDPLWDHRLRWRVRDTWGRVRDEGDRSFRVTEDRMTHRLHWLDVTEAGRRFVDLWLETPDGRTLDWGTGFIDRDRGVASPAIELKHPHGAPRGEPIAGKVRFDRDTHANADAEVAAVRVTMLDRHWRQVHHREHPVNGANNGANNGAVSFAIDTEGLDGVIWQLHAELLDARGRVLAETHTAATSPKSFGERSGFYAIGTITTHSSPIGAARRELIGRLGFTGSRPYTGGSAMIAEASAWQDWEMFPHAVRMTSSNDDYAGPRVNDWADPTLVNEYQQILGKIADEMRRFGHRGFNLTDDSSAARELPLGIYTTLAFHDWLEQTYGSPKQVARAWGIDLDTFEQAAQAASEHTEHDDGTADDVRFPRSAHVAEAFHRWLEDRYGSVQETFRQWHITVTGPRGKPHSWGRVHYVLIEEQAESGNDRPWRDAREFLREQTFAVHPLGHIEQNWIRRKHDDGVTGPWIDAQRFSGFRWIDAMQQLRTGARAANPELFVGTDAGFYYEHLGEVFGHFDYLAPYRGDWWALHTAVARGAHRRAGIFGSCIGSYEQQPPRMYDLRAQPWAILFNGGTGLYYWSFTRGLLGDLTLSDDHARYQTEVTEEIGRGIGELFTGATRIFDPVAILDSQHSGLNDRLADPEAALTTHSNSTLAFHRMLMTDLGLTPEVVTATELADGWLDESRVKVLILPGVSAMAQPEIDAVRRFVEEGGTVVADVLPGRLHPNSRRRDGSPLAEVFGVRARDDVDQPRRRGALSWNGQPLGQTLADARIEPGGAQAHGRVADEVPAFLEHQHGEGTTWLFNAFAGTYEAVQRADEYEAAQQWLDRMRELLLDAGLEATISPSAATRAPGTLALSPFKQSGGHLLGVEDRGSGLEQGQWREMELVLSEPRHIYEIRGGRYLGQSDTLRDQIPRRGHRAYALLPYAVENVALTLEQRTLAAGQTLRIEVGLVLDRDDAPANEHVVRVEVYDPDGKRFHPHQRIVELRTDSARDLGLRTSPDDAAGTWTVRATDISTGVATERRFELQLTGE